MRPDQSSWAWLTFSLARPDRCSNLTNHLRVIDGKKLAPALAGGKGSAPTAEAIASSPNAEIIGIFKELADYFFKSGEESEKGLLSNNAFD